MSEISLPMKINQNDLDFQKDYFFIDYQGKTYQSKNYVFKDIKIKKNTDGIKIIHYLLTSKATGLKKIVFMDDGFCRLDLERYYHNTTVKNDPEPYKDIVLTPFDILQRLESLHWHILCHGVADFWLNSGRPLMIKKVNPKDMWQQFRDKIQCKRWGCFEWDDKHENEAKIKKWERQKKRVGGCNGCINEYGADQFLKCCILLEDYRISYLTKIHKWILDTIQDSKMNKFYKQNSIKKNNDFKPSRMHIHIERDTDDLHAYVIETDETFDVYKMIFENYKNEKNKFFLKTVYGEVKMPSYEEARKYIIREVKRRFPSVDNPPIKCYESNWQNN